MQFQEGLYLFLSCSSRIGGHLVVDHERLAVGHLALMAEFTPDHVVAVLDLVLPQHVLAGILNGHALPLDVLCGGIPIHGAKLGLGAARPRA